MWWPGNGYKRKRMGSLHPPQCLWDACDLQGSNPRSEVEGESKRKGKIYSVINRGGWLMSFSHLVPMCLVPWHYSLKLIQKSGEWVSLTTFDCSADGMLSDKTALCLLMKHLFSIVKGNNPDCPQMNILFLIHPSWFLLTKQLTSGFSPL